MTTRIQSFMAAGERDREQSMRIALSHDPRFDPLVISSDIPVDLQFKIVEYSEDYPENGGRRIRDFVDKNALNIELKRPMDLVQSVLSGHLMKQTLSIRESGYNGCTVILGDSGEIAEAIRDSAQGRGIKKAEIGHVIATTHSRCKSFRKRSFLNGIPIFHKGDDSGFFDSDDQWKDILELAHDYLLDGDMMGFRQRPAENEREVAAAAMLHKGIGSDSMRILLKEYTLCFCPRGEYAKPIEELPGFGPKRCAQVNPMIRMIYGRHA
jgi:hypothetical protein